MGLKVGFKWFKNIGGRRNFMWLNKVMVLVNVLVFISNFGYERRNVFCCGFCNGEEFNRSLIGYRRKMCNLEKRM